MTLQYPSQNNEDSLKTSVDIVCLWVFTDEMLPFRHKIKRYFFPAKERTTSDVPISFVYGVLQTEEFLTTTSPRLNAELKVEYRIETV